MPRLYETVHQGVMQKFAAGSVVQRAVVAVVMWVSRAYMHARRSATNRLFVLHASFTRLVYTPRLRGPFGGSLLCIHARERLSATSRLPVSQEQLTRIYSASIKALLRLYYGSTEALSNLTGCRCRKRSWRECSGGLRCRSC